jgi:hypothetical protein
MDDADNRIEVLKEIRDEIRGVRSELAELRGARLTTSGVRTQVVDRAARWRIGALASTGALAVVALVLALRAGPASVPAATAPSVAMPPAPAVAPPAVVASAPKVAPPAPVAAATQPLQPVAATATKPVAKPAPRLLASAPAAPTPRKRVKPEAAPEAAPATTADDGDTIPFPPPRRVRVHKMSYGPVETEPAKL